MTPTRQAHLRTWWDLFLEQVQNPDDAPQLKEASLAANLREWTRLTTRAVVRCCESNNWEATARGHRLERLPELASEYLSLDAMAFANRHQSDCRWPLPLAVFELENSSRDDRVAYSLWKVLCVRAPLRMVFAYRDDWQQARGLVDYVAREVVAAIPPEQRISFDGETALVTGSRGEGETFPFGYFKCWMLDTNLATFDRL